jgi:hypothetical protein
MISKIFKYSNFDAVLRHVFVNVGATLINTNMTSRNATMLAKEFQLFSALNTQEQCACCHIIFSLISRNADHAMGECNQHLGDYEYYRIVRRYLEEMGFLGVNGLHKSQYIAARYRNKDREEIHIIVSRIRMDGTVVSRHLEERRNDVVVKQLKHEFNLEDLEDTEMVGVLA